MVMWCDDGGVVVIVGLVVVWQCGDSVVIVVFVVVCGLIVIVLYESESKSGEGIETVMMMVFELAREKNV